MDQSDGTSFVFNSYCCNLGAESSLAPKTASSKGYFKVESDTKVKCGDLHSSQPTEYTFTKIFDGSHDFSLSCYNTAISPLVNQTLKGESSIAIFGGQPSLNFSNYLTSQTGMHGLISQAATQLLAYLNRDGNRLGRVTFSWYQLDVSSFESVTDILKCASNSSSSAASDNKAATQLALREIGKGRGMYVPGIWEVEIANGGDVEAVILRIIQMLPVSDHSKGNCHTVMQLSITNSALADKSADKDKGVKIASGNQCIDGPGVGRLTFLMLSELAQRSTNSSASSNSEPTYNFDRPYHWNSHLNATINWVESKRPSPPFHKSRMVLFLRDVLYGRQNASLILLLKPSVESTQTNFQWLELVAAFHRCYASVRKTSSNVHTFSNSIKPGALMAQSASHSSTSENVNTNNFQSMQLNQSSNNAASAVSFSQLVSDNSRLPPPPPSSNYNNNNNNSNNNNSSSSSVSSRVSIKDTINKQNLIATQQLNNNMAAASKLNAGDGGYAQREVEIAFQLSIETQKKEIDNLKSMLQMSQDRASDMERAYNDLIAQLKEEGAFLAKRDQERLKKALRDVADYAIYKDVMETAMVKMQEQLDMSVREIQNLTNQLHRSEGDTRKAKSSSEKYTKDLSTAKKTLAELQNSLAQKEKENKTLQKDRDSAIVTLASARSDMGRREGALKAQSELKDQDISDLKRSVALLEDRLKQTSSDKTNMEMSFQMEIQNIRSAQSKTLEMLMKYQSENDSLKSALADQIKS